MFHPKVVLFVVSFLLAGEFICAQQNYNDFESNKFCNFNHSDGNLDSIVTNPEINTVNNSIQCGKYKRSPAVQYDNIKLYLHSRLIDVSPYAINTVEAPKIKMKVYTTAPVGTKIDLQLGKKSDNNFPTGVHSQYRALTTVQNTWEELEFLFLQIPDGSQVSSTGIDKVIIMFDPNSFNNDVYYFDDLIGPVFDQPSGISQNNTTINFELVQNVPNPISSTATIAYTLKSAGLVSLRLYNILGKEISTLIDKQQTPGNYNVTLETEYLPEGTYFYVLKSGELAKTKRMVVSR